MRDIQLTSPQRVLWIAFVFPPIGGTQGLRMRRYLEEMSRIRPTTLIDVLTIRPPRTDPHMDRSLAEGMPDSVRVNRVSPGVLQRLRYLWHLDSRSLACDRELTRAICRYLIFASSVTWIAWAAIWMFLRLRRRYDSIYVFVDPSASLVLALLAGRIFRTARVILEYGDPRIAVGGKRSLPRAAAMAVEERAMLRCSGVIFRTSAAVSAYRKAYPSVPEDRFAVVYGGVDWQSYESVGPAARSSLFTIVYTGMLYPHSVDPGPFFRAIAGCCRTVPVRVVVAGAEDPVISRIVKEYQLEDVVCFTGHIPMSRVVHLQRSASVLLAFGFECPYRIPSKLAQYIASRVPILYIAQSKREPGASLVQELNRGIVVLNEEQAIAGAVDDLICSWENGEVSQRFNLSYADGFSWEQVAGRIVALLDGQVRVV